MILFWLLIAFLSLVASGFIVYPVIAGQNRRYAGSFKLALIFMAIATLIVAIVLYFKWGQSKQLALWYAQRQQVAQLRQQLGSPQLVIARLQQHLKKEPASAQGWFLLGKLYFSQQQYDAAAAAYAQLTRLRPDDADFLVQYAQALYFANGRKMSFSINRLLHQALRHDPENALAINLLAVESYRSRHYAEAIRYWQQLLNQYPPDSNDYHAIDTAIENAKAALQPPSHDTR